MCNWCKKDTIGIPQSSGFSLPMVCENCGTKIEKELNHRNIKQWVEKCLNKIKQSEKIEEKNPMFIEPGWKFYSSDFSIQASEEKPKTPGTVTLIREPVQRFRWHELSEQIKESDICPELYVYGSGCTLEEAINKANLAARNAKKIPIYSRFFGCYLV